MDDISPIEKEDIENKIIDWIDMGASSRLIIFKPKNRKQGADLVVKKKIFDKLKERGIRVELDDRTESVGKKIRDAQLEKVPYMLIVGDKEKKAGTVAVRLRSEKDLGQLSLEKFISDVKEKIESKSLDL